ncbi:sulfite exporter TauE/SafE family protein [Oceanisphaera pacifica]|uniref:Sulfite exporter TauE/SafE family protein n=1 Tax=Oceanisphaera pacifica TaxID=2818389 RepID=A0ABS3NGE0_9GAMM|nr:sulfite exporter TauE/SafE family protein [Oceanisphaera pacifica]MBO1519453.1 sulfite exporter TauE/SafE family protein [Oceanisphaera pacifica]
MTTQLDAWAALLIGFLGAGHCIAMCGGVAAAFSMAIPKEQQRWQWLYLLSYNAGRILSYSIAGALVGGIFASLAEVSAGKHALVYFRLLTGVMMILLGLYLARWWFFLLHLEKLGAGIWRHIKPLASRFIPFKSPLAAFPFGMVWGWLPCGLVYSALTWSAVSGGALEGARVMALFGLGTLPTLLALGGLAGQLRHWLNHPKFRQVSGILLICYGLFTLYQALPLL